MNLFKNFIFIKIIMFTFIIPQTSFAELNSYKTEGNISEEDRIFVKRLKMLGKSWDGKVSIKLLNPANLKEVFTFIFPTNTSVLAFKHKNSKHYADASTSNTTLTKESEFEPIYKQMAKWAIKMKLVHILRIEDLDDYLAWGHLSKKFPNLSDSQTIPADSLTVILPIKRYSQSLLREEVVGLDDVKSRNNLINKIQKLFPKRTQNKENEIISDLETLVPNLKIKVGRIIPFYETKRCIYSFNLTQQKPPAYNYTMASLSVSGQCVIEGIEFNFLRGKRFDQDDLSINPSNEILESANYIEDYIETIKVTSIR